MLFGDCHCVIHQYSRLMNLPGAYHVLAGVQVAQQDPCTLNDPLAARLWYEAHHQRAMLTGKIHHGIQPVYGNVQARNVLRSRCRRAGRLASSSTAQEMCSVNSSIVDGQFATELPSYTQQSVSVAGNGVLVQGSPASSSTVSDVSSESLSTSSTTSPSSSTTVYNNILPHVRQSNGNGTSGLCVASSISSSCSSIATRTGLSVCGAGATGLGRRQTNEDRHALSLLNIETGSTAANQWIYGGVFDGHGGHATAANLADLFHHGLQQQLQLAQRHQLDTRLAVVRAFADFDSYWAVRCPDNSGSTAVVALLDGDRLLVANAGDSAAILARGNSTERLSTLHKPDDPAEAARIRSSGGVVERHPRVSNAWRALIDPAVLPQEELACRTALTVTRGFGDYTFKRAFAPIVSAEPAIAELQLSPSDHLLLLVSDGVTDALYDKSMVQVALAAVDQAKCNTADGPELARAAATAVKDTAIRMGAADNVTVVALLLDWDEMSEELQSVKV